MLKYQFTDECRLKISDQCCKKLKKETAYRWQKEHWKRCTMTGMRHEEGNWRKHIDCITTANGWLTRFHPLLPCSESFIDWFIDKYGIRLCELYYPPYSFKRTGCKGCPFNPELQEQLDVMKELMPAEYRQCEMIWKPVYDEYRRLGYRLSVGKDEVNAASDSLTDGIDNL